MTKRDSEMSVSDNQNGVSAFDLEPNPFEQSFASTKEQQSGSLNAQQPSQSCQEQQPSAQQLPQRSESRPPLNVSRNTGPKSPFFQGSQKPNILSPPLLTPGGFRRLPPLLLSPTCVPQTGSTAAVVRPGQGAAVTGPQSGGISNSNTNSGAPSSSGGSGAVKPDFTRTPSSSFFLNLAKTGLTPNESSLRTGLTPGILAPGQGHHHYPTLPALNGVNQGPPQAKPGSNGNGGTPPPPFTPGLGSLLGFPGAASPGQTGRPPFNSENPPENYQSVAESVAIPQDNTQTQKFSPESSRQQKKSPPRPDSPNQPPTSRKRNTSNASKTSKISKKSQTSTPNSVENRRAFKSEESHNVEDSKDSNEDDQERKRKEFLERNRVAASKFRRRKKEYIKRVEMDLKFYESEYDDMSRALDKLCGIVQGSPTPAASSSLISTLENAISQNDVPSSLSILAHMKQVTYETRYFQRNGRNPRREMEKAQETDDEERHRTDNDSTGQMRSRNGSSTAATESVREKRSSITYPDSVPASFANTAAQYLPPVQPMSTGSMPNFPRDTGSVPGLVKSEPNLSNTFPLSLIDSKRPASELDVTRAIGNTNSLPELINGKSMGPVNDVNSQGAPKHNSVSDVRHSSLVDLANQSIRAEPTLPKYPHTE